MLTGQDTRNVEVHLVHPTNEPVEGFDSDKRRLIIVTEEEWRLSLNCGEELVMVQTFPWQLYAFLTQFAITFWSRGKWWEFLDKQFLVDIDSD